MRREVFLGLVLLGVALLIAGITMLRSPSGAASAAVGQVTLTADAANQWAAEGSAAPDFEVKYASGQTIRLSDLKGKPVLVNFWATWCTFCKSETPALQKSFEKYESEGFVIVGVDQQETVRAVDSFAKRYGLTFNLGIDASGAVGRQYGVNGIPASYFIDRNGIIRRIYVGAMTTSDIDQFYAEIR